jgi:hypothetical protein
MTTDVTHMLNAITEQLTGGKITSALIDAHDEDRSKHRVGLRIDNHGTIYHAWISTSVGSFGPGWLHIEEQE